MLKNLAVLCFHWIFDGWADIAPCHWMSSFLIINNVNNLRIFCDFCKHQYINYIHKLTMVAVYYTDEPFLYSIMDFILFWRVEFFLYCWWDSFWSKNMWCQLSSTKKKMWKLDGPETGKIKCVCVIQHPPKPAVWNLLPSCGCWWEGRVGICLGHVSDLQQHLGERPAPSRSVLHQEDLVAQQVKHKILMCMTHV